MAETYVKGWFGVSIHAPVKGRLPDLEPLAIKFLVSIHAPVKGRRMLASEARGDGKFQSTPP